MKKFQRHQVGIEQGESILFSDFNNDGLMWTGTGQREIRNSIRFSENYAEAPLVQLGLAMFDVSNSSNTRMDIRADEVTRHGFSIVFCTWADTRVARVRVSWQAIGPIRDEDTWDIA